MESEPKVFFTGCPEVTTKISELHSAFERRFLYKINFHKPDLATRLHIWQSMMPNLAKSDVAVLAERYDFSGGQMENITRKATVEHILTGQMPSLETLTGLCECGARAEGRRNPRQSRQRPKQLPERFALAPKPANRRRNRRLFHLLMAAETFIRLYPATAYDERTY